MFPFVPQPPWPPHHQASFAPRRAHLAHVPAASASLSVVERWNDPTEVYGLYGPWWVSHDFTYVFTVFVRWFVVLFDQNTEFQNRCYSMIPGLV